MKNIEDVKLYPVSRMLSKDALKKLGLRFPVKINVQDPFIAEKNKLLGIHDIDITWEPGISDGPTSSRIAVVDYNLNTNVLVKPVEWDGEKKTFLIPDGSDHFHFHQVNVWAVIQNVLSFFEDPFVMGRPIPWGFEGNRLMVVPHAGIMKNAFYDRNSKSMQFYYFMNNDKPVYTCLSHDMVSHETGHAVLDGIRPHYLELGSSENAAFHEFIADLTSILSSFRNNEVRREVARISGGDLSKATVIADLAEEFARADMQEVYADVERYYLRSATNNLKMKDIENKWESHECSQVLTGAMFEILTRIVKLQMDLGLSPRAALWKATDHFNRVAFRALDYGPPADIEFLDYARAVLRANEVAYPIDTLNYQEIIRLVFKKRGVPDLSVPKPPHSVDLIWKYDIVSMAQSRTAAYQFLHDNRGAFDIPGYQDFAVTDIYITDKVVHNYVKLPREIIIQYLWSENILLEGSRFGRFQDQTIPLLCGGTLVFDERGNILYWSQKHGTENVGPQAKKEGNRRKKRLLDYLEKLIQNRMAGSDEETPDGQLNMTKPPVLGKKRNGILHFQSNPGLLHHSQMKGGKNE